MHFNLCASQIYIIIKIIKISIAIKDFLLRVKLQRKRNLFNQRIYMEHFMNNYGVHLFFCSTGQCTIDIIYR